MALKAEHSLAASLAVMGLDYGLYSLAMPNLADVKATPPHSSHVESARKAVTITAVSASAGLALATREPNVFIFGAGFAIVLDFWYRHANATHPGTGQVTMPPVSGTQPGGVSAA